MRTHTVGMWSQPLGGAADSRTGHPCNCHKVPAAPGHTAILTDIADTIPDIARKYTRIGGSRGLNQGLRIELVTTIIVEVEQEGNEQEVCVALRKTLQHLSQQNDRRTDVSPPPISPKRQEDDGPLSPRSAARGLRAMGSVPIPQEMWRRHAPTNRAWVAAHTPPVGASRGTAMEVLATRMAQDGLLTPLPEGPPQNARTFAKRKSAAKGAFVVDARIVNWYSLPPTGRLCLPSLEQLGAIMGIMRLRGIRVKFTKLDISKTFYTCCPPQEANTGIRV